MRARGDKQPSRAIRKARGKQQGKLGMICQLYYHQDVSKLPFIQWVNSSSTFFSLFFNTNLQSQTAERLMQPILGISITHAFPFICSLTSPQRKKAKAYANIRGQLQQEFKELSQQLESKCGNVSTSHWRGTANHLHCSYAFPEDDKPKHHSVGQRKSP